MLEIRNITLESPDCGGKSTLYRNIHSATNFRWNVQDRGQLSMLCYARQFDRGEAAISYWRRELRSFLLDLNNRLIVLLPDFQVLSARLAKRGDEFQNHDSLRILHRIFEEEVSLLVRYPNVLVVRDVFPDAKDLAQFCIPWLTKATLYSPRDVAQEVRELAEASPKQEAAGCRFQFRIDPTSSAATDVSALQHPPEEAYYAKILSEVLQNIDDEIAGKNVYRVKQDVNSTRRFIFTQDSCISLIHTTVRESSFNIRVYCRSSDAEDTFPHDLQFICYLTSRIYAKLLPQLPLYRAWKDPHVDNVTIDVELGSAHIP